MATARSPAALLDMADIGRRPPQREACEAYIKSQAHEGWRLIPDRYDDGAFSGASLERPALQQLLAELRCDRRHRGLQSRPADPEQPRCGPEGHFPRMYADNGGL
jgi:hypothetical protein